LQCGASHVAAERAIEAGYSDVAVLPDGIKGWKQAGQATTPAPQS
jgi:rhodanese-related sulfurtransferase